MIGKEIIKIETRSGNPVMINEMQITPISKSVQIFPEKISGALIWNRPHAVLVRTVSNEYILPVKDYTRRAQFMLFGIGLIGMLFAWLTYGRKS